MNGKNKIKEIVGTNINNKGMPLIRYRTEDFVEFDESSNIVSIVGRTNDFVVNKNNDIVPCILVTRQNIMENVLAAQYYQDKIGELIYKIRINEKFSEKDARIIQDEIAGCFQGLMQVTVEPVNDFEKTKNGKHIRLIQKLDLKNIKSA
jgi:phenylacetate-CoA ligase